MKQRQAASMQQLCKYDDCTDAVRLPRAALSLSASLFHTRSPMTQCTEFCEKWNDFWECDGYDVDGFLAVWISTSNRTTHAQAHAWNIIKSGCKHLIGTASVHDTERYGLPAKYAASSVSMTQRDPRWSDATTARVLYARDHCVASDS